MTAPALEPPRVTEPRAQLTVAVAYLDDAINAVRHRPDLMSKLARAHGLIYEVAIQLHRERIAENATQEMDLAQLRKELTS